MSNSNSKEDVPVYVPTTAQTKPTLETKVMSEKAKTMVTVGVFLIGAVWFGYNNNLLTVPLTAMGVLVYMAKSNFTL